MTADDVGWWIESKSVEELIGRAGRCTLLDCDRHGVFNRELRRRRLAFEAGDLVAPVEVDEE